MNFLSIMASLLSISTGMTEEVYYMDYFKIPENKKEKLFDLLIRNASFKHDGQSFLIDIGIRRKEIENLDFTNFTHKGEIAEIGDLGNYYGFEEINANNLDVRSTEKYLLIGAKANFELIGPNDRIHYRIENGFLVE